MKTIKKLKVFSESEEFVKVINPDGTRTTLRVALSEKDPTVNTIEDVNTGEVTKVVFDSRFPQVKEIYGIGKNMIKYSSRAFSNSNFQEGYLELGISPVDEDIREVKKSFKGVDSLYKYVLNKGGCIKTSYDKDFINLIEKNVYHDFSEDFPLQKVCYPVEDTVIDHYTDFALRVKKGILLLASTNFESTIVLTLVSVSEKEEKLKKPAYIIEDFNMDYHELNSKELDKVPTDLKGFIKYLDSNKYIKFNKEDTSEDFNKLLESIRSHGEIGILGSPYANVPSRLMGTVHGIKMAEDKYLDLVEFPNDNQVHILITKESPVKSIKIVSNFKLLKSS